MDPCSSVMQNLAEKYPQVSEKLGGGYKELKSMAEERGPEAMNILDDTTRQVKDIFSKGFTPERLNKARELMQSKTEAVRKLAWTKAVQEEGPYLGAKAQEETRDTSSS